MWLVDLADVPSSAPLCPVQLPKSKAYNQTVIYTPDTWRHEPSTRPATCHQTTLGGISMLSRRNKDDY